MFEELAVGVLREAIGALVNAVLLPILGVGGYLAVKWLKSQVDLAGNKLEELAKEAGVPDWVYETVVDIAVKAVEQIGEGLAGEEKLSLAINAVEKLAADRGIDIDLDIALLYIEKAVHEIKNS